MSPDKTKALDVIVEVAGPALMDTGETHYSPFKHHVAVPPQNEVNVSRDNLPTVQVFGPEECRSMIEKMRKSPRELNVQLEGLQSIARLSYQNQENWKIFGKGGAPELIVQAMYNFSDNKGIQLQGCR